MLWCVGVQAQTNVAPAALDPNAAITRLREGLVDSFNKGDIDRLLSHLDTNVVVTWQNAEVSKGREGVREYYNRMMKGDKPIVRAIKSNPEVLGRNVYGDWAISWGRLNDVFTLEDGNDVAFNSLFTATIARRGEQWLVTGYHASVDAFDNAILRMAVKRVSLIAGGALGVAGVIIGFVIGRVTARKRHAR